VQPLEKDTEVLKLRKIVGGKKSPNPSEPEHKGARWGGEHVCQDLLAATGKHKTSAAKHRRGDDKSDTTKKAQVGPQPKQPCTKIVRAMEERVDRGGAGKEEAIGGSRKKHTQIGSGARERWGTTGVCSEKKEAQGAPE